MSEMSAKERKEYPLCTGVLDYFPDALMEIAHLSKVGNDQHNPGQPLHWARDKSTDHGDALLRHQKDRGKRDTDGERHSAKVAWRALAQLQVEIEEEKKDKNVELREIIQYSQDLEKRQKGEPEWRDWNPTHSSECPVLPNTLVEVMFRNEKLGSTGEAHCWNWTDLPPRPYQIVKYRVVRQSPTDELDSLDGSLGF